MQSGEPYKNGDHHPKDVVSKWCVSSDESNYNIGVLPRIVTDKFLALVGHSNQELDIYTSLGVWLSSTPRSSEYKLKLVQMPINIINIINVLGLTQTASMMAKPAF